MITRRNLPDVACDEIWSRINRKKYAYGFGRDNRFIDRCARLQTRLLNVMSLRRLERSGVKVDDVLEGNLTLMKKMLGKKVNGNSSSI